MKGSNPQAPSGPKPEPPVNPPTGKLADIRMEHQQLMQRMDELTESMRQQTQAIMALVRTNDEMLVAMLDADGSDESSDDSAATTYMDGTPVN